MKFRKRPPGRAKALAAVEQMIHCRQRLGHDRLSHLRFSREGLEQRRRLAQGHARIEHGRRTIAVGRLRRTKSIRICRWPCLQPGLGIRAAEVPLKMEVGVTNYGPSVARDVSVQLAEDGRARPAVTIAAIPPGQTATANFEVRYHDSGQHTITARLPADAVAVDNARYSVLDFPQNVPVLVIDGDPRAMAKRGDAYFIALPFASSQIAPTGDQAANRSVATISAIIRSTAFMSFILLNIDRLDQPEIDAVEDYLRHGGGVVFFVGDRTRADFMNTRLYRDGKGPFPVPLVGPTELLVDRTEPVADLTVDEPEHPVFSIWARKASVDIDRMIVDRYFAVQKDWLPAEGSTARVLVRLRNGAPLVVERKFGDGRVMAFLTTAAPNWNNLANTPRDVAAMLQLTAYISAARQTDPGRQVGTPLEVDVDRGKYQTEVKFTTPHGGAAGVFPVEAAPPKRQPQRADGAKKRLPQKTRKPADAAAATSPGDPKTDTRFGTRPCRSTPRNPAFMKCS